MLDNDEYFGEITDHISADIHVGSRDFDECILKLGSYMSIIQCKKLSPIQLFIIIAQTQKIQQIVLEMVGLDTFEQFIREYAKRYPIICKSKIITTKLAKNHKNVKHNR